MEVRKSKIFYCLVLIALMLRIGSESTANISYFILALAALFGNKEAIQALALCWLFTILSPGIAPSVSLGAVGRYAIIFAATASVFLRYRPSHYQPIQNRIVLHTLAFGILLLVHSLLFSVVPDVSILKVISWTVTLATLCAAWNGLSMKQSDQLVQQLFAGLTIIMLVSLPLVVLPLGYLRNGTGFQGILSHPQAFGPVMSLLGAWFALRLLTLPRPPWKIVLYTGVCLVLIIISEARIAGFALVGGVFSSIVLSAILTRRSITVLFPGLRSSRVSLVIICSIFVSSVFLPQLIGRFDTYVSKRTDIVGVLAAYEDSRGGLMERMMNNISEQPMTGIGFGIASNPMNMDITRDPIFGLPVGATIEKGILPIAVVEEVGVFGLLLFLLWGWSMLRAALKVGGATVGLLGTIILLNFGESTFFSVGGFGMFSLILMGWITSSHKKYLVNQSV